MVSAAPRGVGTDLVAGSTKLLFRPLHLMVSAPSLLFLFTMGLMLFRPPDYRFHSYDRYAFVLLLLVIGLRICLTKARIQLGSPIFWPMIALLGLCLADTLTQPYDPEPWSILASKWLVPFGLYCAAGYAFRDSAALRRFEIFSLAVLAYLSVIAILFMVGAKQLIFPRYILDESLGIHADRARGPFLQAVANGLALNLLGVLALDSFRRGRLRGVPALLLGVTVPLAVAATRTRAVWLSFGASILLIGFFSSSRRLRRACLFLALASTVGLISFVVLSDHHRSLSDRLAESGPVKFRVAVYEAGWEMFRKKPLAGWGAVAMQNELTERISEFHQEQYYFHNTYLEILVQYGLVGLALYAWLIVGLFRLGGEHCAVYSPNSYFLDAGFRSIWPVLLVVYLVNASFVVMNYQFVNGFLFSIAGMLAGQNRRGAEELANAAG
jgi:O-antigen ligase